MSEWEKVQNRSGTDFGDQKQTAGDAYKKPVFVLNSGLKIKKNHIFNRFLPYLDKKP
jgi:hypothetical protein